jgi:FKBP-type peptidyl-prolyl cis-trans isomerase SlyD
MIENGKTVTIDYVLVVDGAIVDSTRESGPFEYIQGQDPILPGLQKQLEGLEAGDGADFIVGPEDAYGIIDPRAFTEVAKGSIPPEALEEGARFQVSESDGKVYYVTVAEIKPQTVVLNFNHPLAGKELHFNVQIVKVA